jgi:hypothetical protein
MNEAAPQAAMAAERATGQVCRRCVGGVTVKGDPEWGPAVHAATGRERGADGHLVAPIDASIVQADAVIGAGARS